MLLFSFVGLLLFRFEDGKLFELLFERTAPQPPKRAACSSQTTPPRSAR